MNNGQRIKAWRGSSEWHDLVPRLLQEHKSRRVAEIGVWKGELSRLILGQCPRIESLLLVDPWHPTLAQADGRWWYVGPGTTWEQMNEAMAVAQAAVAPWAEKVEIRRLPSVEAAGLIADQSLDAVLIDALHFENTVIEDITAWRPKLRPRGLLIGDDYSDYYPGVQRGVEAMFGRYHRVLGQTWWTIPDAVPPAYLRRPHDEVP